jgi:hypothetical protein
MDGEHYGCVSLFCTGSYIKPGVDLVKMTLESNFASKGLVHKDIAWRHIGLYTGELEQHAVVFDLGRVKVAS